MKNFSKQFGGKITKELEANYQQSKNWKNGVFHNLEKTRMSIKLTDVPKLLYQQFIANANRMPAKNLPLIPFDLQAFLTEDSHFKFSWYGHSAILSRINSKTILIDPMLGSNTSPIAPFKTKRFSRNTLDLIVQFPEIDLMLISHDHYDHLDFDSIQKLKHKTKLFYVALGVKRHLIEWGINPEIIHEFDWWNQAIYSDIEITFTPTRHFSGRGIKDRNRSLWGGWALKTASENIWFSGDSGYGAHFKEIGNKLGPFDFAFMECGQYNEKWHNIHMFPHESVQAALDAKVKRAMPVHWAGFSLSLHEWFEPVVQFKHAATTLKLNSMYPKLGQILNLNTEIEVDEWWLKI